LCRETSLDSSDGTSRSARIAGDEKQSVFSFVEFGIWGSAGFAGDVFHCEEY